MNDLIRLLQKLSLEESSSWARLLAEILQIIGGYAFLPDNDYHHPRLRPQAVKPQPNLTFANLNHQCREIFEKRILSESIFILLEIRVCSVCESSYTDRFGTASYFTGPFSRVFDDYKVHPWLVVCNGASVVSISIQCHRYDRYESHTDRTRSWSLPSVVQRTI